MEKIMITGGAGFIGSNLVDYILKNTDWKLFVLDDLSSGSFEKLKEMDSFDRKRIELHEGDIRSRMEVEKAMKDCDYVVNLAAQVGVIPSKEDPYKDMEVNVLGVINVLESAVGKNVDKLVQSSSAAPLGDVEPPVSEEDVPEPMAPYGASKLAGEGYCSAYTHSFDLNTVALRFSNVYGPKSLNKESVVHKFIKRILKGEKLKIYGDGKQTRDYVHVKDICGAIGKALELGTNGFELIQLGTGKETSVNELVDVLQNQAEKLGVEMPEVVHEKARSGEIRRNYSKIKKAEKLLGFKPTVNLEEGIEETFQWFLNKEDEIK